MKGSTIDLDDGQTTGATPVVVHLSITPEGGWHSHAIALADLADEHGPGRHVVLHWPGASTPRRARAAEFRCAWLGHRATGALTTLRQVAETARRLDADWIHVHGLPSEPIGLVFTVALRLALRGTGASLAITPHNAFGRRGPVEFRRLRRVTLRRYDRVFVFHDDHRTWAGRRAARSPFVHPGPDQLLGTGGGQRRSPLRQRQPDGRRIACLPGQIRADKGFHLVPAALAGQDYAIRIAGTDNGGYAKLQSAAEQHGVPLIGRPGFADEDEFLTTIAESDVVILPYRRVTQSGVLAYARATGTPVAASTALLDAGLEAEAYFDLDDNDSLLAAVEQAIEAGGTPRSGAGTPGEPPDATHLYEPIGPITEVADSLRACAGVFVVGSPRSGTTVVARWLADRLGSDLPPETHYFTSIRPALTRSRTRKDFHRRVRRLSAYAGATDRDTETVADTWWPPTGPRSLPGYLASHGDPWVEKTPGHLRRWPELLRVDGRARIVVVTRSLPATLVSQTEVAWLAGRHPSKLLARLIADRLHLHLVRLAAPQRIDVIRYEDFVAEVEALPEAASAALPHEHWKELSGTAGIVDDRNRAARDRRPAVWEVAVSRRQLALATPGAVVRVLIDLARSLRGVLAARR